MALSVDSRRSFEKTSDNVGMIEDMAKIEVKTGNEIIELEILAQAASKALVRKQDIRIMPLCAAIYLLCYLDRSNIGNAKILNSSTGNDLLQETGMTNYQYIIALMVFLIAYWY